MNNSNQIQEAEVQHEIREHYQPLRAPMVKTTQTKVNKIIEKLHRSKHIDDMTKKWLSQTSSPPRIPVFYKLTKIHKPVLVGRPIIGTFRLDYENEIEYENDFSVLVCRLHIITTQTHLIP